MKTELKIEIKYDDTSSSAWSVFISHASGEIIHGSISNKTSNEVIEDIMENLRYILRAIE